MGNFEIKELSGNDNIPYNLLYMADPFMEAIRDYLKRGICYAGYFEDVAIGVYVLLPTRPFTVELVNLAVSEKYQGMGYGKLFIYHAIETAKLENYQVLEVGTGNSGIGQLALYQKCGFTICSVDFDFFSKHYSESIIENGIECRHMIRMKMDL